MLNNIDPFWIVTCFIAIISIIFYIILAVPKYIKYKHFEGRLGSVKNNVDYNRRIPLNMNLPLIFSISMKYGITFDKYNLISAYILKYIYDNKIKIIKKDNVVYFDLNSLNGTHQLDIEQKIITFFKKSSKSEIISEKEFSDYIVNNIDKLIMLIDDIDRLSMKELYKMKLVTFNKKFIATKELDIIANEIMGLKKFLNDFSIINERESLEVKLWNEYLIMAALFGIADNVEKEYKSMFNSIDFNFDLVIISKRINKTNY